MRPHPENSLSAPSDTVEIVVLEGEVCAEMVAHQDGHYLAFGHPTRTVPMPYAIFPNGRQTKFFGEFVTQILVKFIDNTENLYKTMSLVIIAYSFCSILILNYKYTKYRRDYQFFLFLSRTRVYFQNSCKPLNINANAYHT